MTKSTDIKTTDIKVPDIGDFRDVDIIEVLVAEGDSVAQESPLITLETDKATMDIPCPQAGKVAKLLVKVGDKVSQGDPIIALSTAATSDRETPTKPPAKTTATSPPAGAQNTDLHSEVVVLGAGPGGYTAAFRAADLGKQVTLIERYPNIGGVCLNVGCIPSKALLHTAQIINEAAQISAHGIKFAAPDIDLSKLDAWKNRVISKLTNGLAALAKQRKVNIITGTATITSPHALEVTTKDANAKTSKTTIGFDNLIIAAGSQATQIPSFPNADPRIMDSTAALQLNAIPKRLLVIGGGIIGLEMATVYDALGAEITVVELSPELIPGCDRDLLRPLENRLQKRYQNIFTATQITAIEASKSGLEVHFKGDKAPPTNHFDAALVAVGRRPNGNNIGAKNAGISVTEQGFIPVDNQQKTNVGHIYAIGDIASQPMLAHKATHEGKVAAEVICGMKSHFDARTIPAVAYTDPEIAWMGITETQAKADGIAYEKGVFPWAASGRALSNGRSEGITKVLFDKQSGRVIGAGIVGTNAGELIAEAVLAMEMGANAEDIGLTIHPHPTLSETVNFAAEIAHGTITDLYLPKKK